LRDVPNGVIDLHNSDDEDEAHLGVGTDRTITVVGGVRGKIAVVVDDMIDGPLQFVATAEHLMRRGGAKRVLVLATHAVLGGDCLEAMNACSDIHTIVVTNTIPISQEQRALCTKLKVIDIAPLISEAIRRNKHGESLHLLFTGPAGVSG